MLVVLDVVGWEMVGVVELLDGGAGAGEWRVVMMLLDSGIRVRVAVIVIPSRLRDKLGVVVYVALRLLDSVIEAEISMDGIPVPIAAVVEPKLEFASMPLIVNAEAGSSTDRVPLEDKGVENDKLVIDTVAEATVSILAVPPRDTDAEEDAVVGVVLVLIVDMSGDGAGVTVALPVTIPDSELGVVISMLVVDGIRLVLFDTAIEDEEVIMVTALSIVGVKNIRGVEDVLGISVTLLLIDMDDISGAKDELGMALMLLFVCATIDTVGVV